MAQSAAPRYGLAVLPSTAALGAALLLRSMADVGMLPFVAAIVVGGRYGALTPTLAATLT